MWLYEYPPEQRAQIMLKEAADAEAYADAIEATDPNVAARMREFAEMRRRQASETFPQDS